MNKTEIHLKRVYDRPEKGDGFRVLADRLWPRGLKKTEARIDAWVKETAPSPELRKWFAHDPEKWQGFRKAYMKELQQNESAGLLLSYLEEHPVITLVYAARDTAHNHALVLREFLESR